MITGVSAARCSGTPGGWCFLRLPVESGQLGGSGGSTEVNRGVSRLPLHALLRRGGTEALERQGRRRGLDLCTR